MRKYRLIVGLCFLSINAWAQKITVTTYQDIETILTKEETQELKKLVSGERTFMSSYSDGTVERYQREDNNATKALFMEGYFSPSIIENNEEFTRIARDIEVVSINLHKSPMQGKVKFDLSLFKGLKYVVVNSFKESDLIQITTDFKALSKENGQEIIVVSNLMEQIR
ncbi:hypothetical protein VSP20_12810 [Myroides phaeus]|uniref:hypothetical protein n=1 Tax=Myroides phaeus TaxID=702745 RepID=UPI002DBC92AE|nr:hypothetical protein [Myroides phaeus]MEC4117841.1 hypothetical protein [Myroides phaeus]